jgi:hypothetical protein
MSLLEDLKKTAEKMTGWQRPAKAQLDSLLRLGKASSSAFYPANPGLNLPPTVRNVLTTYTSRATHYARREMATISDRPEADPETNRRSSEHAKAG